MIDRLRASWAAFVDTWNGTHAFALLADKDHKIHAKDADNSNLHAAAEQLRRELEDALAQAEDALARAEHAEGENERLESLALDLEGDAKKLLHDNASLTARLERVDREIVSKLQGMFEA